MLNAIGELPPRIPPSLQVNLGGRVRLYNRTFFGQNSAPDGRDSISIHPGGTVDYTLPAPPGRWLLVSDSASFRFRLDCKTTYSDFPFACSPGIVGGSTPEKQWGPQCWKLWCVH